MFHVKHWVSRETDYNRKVVKNMASVKSGEMKFSMNDLYPNVLNGGIYGFDTSTQANPEADDQKVLGNSDESVDKTSSEPRTLNLWLAILLIIVCVFLFGYN